MTTLKDTILKDLLTIENDLGSPFFTWDGIDYVCAPSSDEKLLTSDTERGNFRVQRVLRLTVRTNVFSDNVFPTSQDHIQYKLATYRVVDVKQDPTGAMLKLICIGTSE